MGFPKNPQYSFTVDEACKGTFILSQKDNRWQSKKNPKYKTAIGWVCMALDEGKNRVVRFQKKHMKGMSRTFVPARTVAGTVELSPGRYSVIPTTFKPGTEKEQFILELYTSKACTYDMEGDELPDLDDVGGEGDDDLAGMEMEEDG